MNWGVDNWVGTLAEERMNGWTDRWTRSCHAPWTLLLLLTSHLPPSRAKQKKTANLKEKIPLQPQDKAPPKEP